MSAMTALFEKFIAKHDLEISTDDLDGLCKQVLVMMYDNAKGVPVSAGKEKSEKLENPAKADDRDDLRNCTKEVLNAFCKENGLRVGGTKKEVMDRAWRFIQDESDEDDISPRAKAKESKKKVVKKDCCGKTAKGTPCQVNGDEIINGKCYCWRHAKDIATSSKASSKADSESEEEEPEPVKPKKKVNKKVVLGEDDEE
jgi:hypothetical protein